MIKPSGLSLVVFLILSGNAFAATSSVSGANIPALPALVDGSSNTWTLGSGTTGGLVYKNGVKDPSSIKVIELLYYNGVIYQENTSQEWHSYNGSGWTSLAADPRKSSANGTVISSTSSTLIDGDRHVWALQSGGTLLRDGAKDATSINVTSLIDYYGVVYQENKSNEFYFWNGANWIRASSDPRKVPTRTISSLGGISCNGTTDSQPGVAAAFEGAASGAYNLLVDCPVYIHTGSDIARPIFIDNDVSVFFTGSGKFIIDNVFVPAFVLANSTGVNLMHWNVEYNGSLPVNEYTGGYYRNGTYVASNGYAPASSAFNNPDADYGITHWLSAHRKIVFSGGQTSFWPGQSDVLASFYIVGDTSGINVLGMNVASSSPTSGDRFIPMIFAFQQNFKSGQTVSRSTPDTSAYYAIPHQLVFADLTLDGYYMGWQGEVADLVITHVIANHYGDLQDAEGKNVGGAGAYPGASAATIKGAYKWSAPPHLMYLKDGGSTSDPNLQNTNITISNIFDNGNRIGIARDSAASDAVYGSGSGNACSLKIGATRSSVSNYITYRPDGFLDLLDSNDLTISNVTATYSSSFLQNLYPGWRNDISPWVNVTIENVSMTDLGTGTTISPIANFGDAGSSGGTGFRISDVTVQLDRSGSVTSSIFPDFGPSTTNDVSITFKQGSSTVQQVLK